MTPQVRMNRSRFDLSKGVKTTMSVGRLYPIDIQEVLPGDTFKNKTVCVARVTSSFLKPVMDNAYMDLYHFFVPYRLLYKDSERVFGNPNPSAYVDNELDSFPSFGTTQQVVSGSIADYLGLPVGRIPGDISVLPFRAFAKVYDQWFRNENTVSEVYIQDGEKVASENINANEFSPNNYTGMPPFVGKKKDYFTACLPSPQKGASVKTAIFNDFLTLENNPNYRQDIYVQGGTNLFVGENSIPGAMVMSSSAVNTGSTINVMANTASVPGTPIPGNSSIVIDPSQWGIDGTSATVSNVNDLRFAFQLQKMLERDALYGSRYNEYLLGHFGVTSPDARLQITEYLGGARIPISVQTVAQTSEGTENSPLANLGAFSLSNGRSRYSKGFVEHGYILTVACIRTMHTYQQGINKMWSRLERNDFYDPLYSSLGEQPVYKSELFATGETTVKGDIFGYNEAWADYRYAPSRISGQMRSGIGNTLDIWHFADYYSNAPTLTEDFTNETSMFFDRTVSVPSQSQDNFICDFWFDTKATRVMPLYSVPGLIDHH
jgi:hypothetical protein